MSTNKNKKSKKEILLMTSCVEKNVLLIMLHKDKCICRKRRVIVDRISENVIYFIWEDKLIWKDLVVSLSDIYQIEETMEVPSIDQRDRRSFVELIEDAFHYKKLLFLTILNEDISQQIPQIIVSLDAAKGEFEWAVRKMIDRKDPQGFWYLHRSCFSTVLAVKSAEKKLTELEFSEVLKKIQYAEWQKICERCISHRKKIEIFCESGSFIGLPSVSEGGIKVRKKIFSWEDISDVHETDIDYIPIKKSVYRENLTYRIPPRVSARSRFGYTEPTIK